MSINVKPIEILLVEDNEGDVVLTLEAFEEAKMKNNVHVVRDGEEALNFLCRNGQYSDAVKPDIILLDLNLPKKDGRQVLEEVKADPDLKTIPVVVMTSSRAERDVVETYKMHANSYIVKPVNLEKFSEVVQAIDNFWFSVVVLPGDIKE